MTDIATPTDTLSRLLQRELEQEYRRRFVAEYEPVGPTEVVLVSELARRAAALDRWGAAATATARLGARHLPQLVEGNVQTHVDSDDVTLTAAMSAEGVLDCERFSVAQARAFHRALAKLEEIQLRRTSTIGESKAMPPPFRGEVECRAYLNHQYCAGRRRCPHCQGSDGCLLKNRPVWECGHCHSQFGLRTGTVMARSPLPLWSWFEAIRCVLWQPSIDLAELSTKVRIQRLATVRTIARRIGDAFTARNATELLVGLDRYYRITGT